MTPNISPGGRPTFEADFKNEGRTPAFVMDEQTSFEVYESKLPSRPQYDKPPSEKPQNAALPLNGVMNIRAMWPDKLPLTQELVNDLKTRNKQLYVFGFVTYDDGFSIHHASGFCLKYVPTTEPTVAKFEGCDEPAYIYYK